MILNCVRNNSDELDECAKNYLSKYIRIDRHETYLCVGKQYLAYGITFWDSQPWFYVYEDEKETYPTAKPHHYFEIIEGTFDPSWRIVVKQTNDGATVRGIIPKEWADDPSFYEALTDDDPERVAAMKLIKTRIAGFAEAK